MQRSGWEVVGRMPLYQTRTIAGILEPVAQQVSLLILSIFVFAFAFAFVFVFVFVF